MKKKVFLLGGHDLEMCTIKELLEARRGDGLLYSDKNLSWSSASLINYEEELRKYGDRQEYQIYGVELREDVRIPENYTSIDHHGDADCRPSSLEQVAEILGVRMDHRMRLVAANDTRYIPGMLKEGATAQEVEDIRREDRRAQGIDKETEKTVKKEILPKKDSVGDLTIVNVPKEYQSLEGVFSVISDWLYPYVALVICTDTELCYYGKDAAEVRKKIFPEGRDGLYSGGGEDGYWGVGIKGETETEDILKKVKGYWRVYSYHVFYFPFKWDFKDTGNKLFTDRYDAEGLKEAPKQKVWRRTRIRKGVPQRDVMAMKEASELFGEKQYFFEFVHPVLYDSMDEKNNILRHYERLEPEARDVKYEIEVKDKNYELKVESINLNIYSTGIGVLTLYLANKKESQKSEADVRNINQYGRRVMPPNAGEFNDWRRGQLAKSISIRGLQSDAEDRYKDTFPYSYIQGETLKGVDDTWTVSSMILNLIHDIFPDMGVVPVVDDRMLVNCWYGNKELSQKIAEYDSFKNFWYKFVFLDEGNDPTCQDREMRDRLLSESTYTRWKDYGTYYGVSRYSLVALTDESGFSTSVIAMHMRTIYARLFELMIVQRASLLRFSGEVTKLCRDINLKKDLKEIEEPIKSLYLGYIRFINQIYFRSVTTQDQGIELYEMISRQFDTERQIKALDGEIDELNRYIDLKIDSRRNKNGEWLNMLAAFFLPGSLVAGLLGMNKWHDVIPDFWWYFGVVVVLSVGLGCLISHLMKQRNK